MRIEDVIAENLELPVTDRRVSKLRDNFLSELLEVQKPSDEEAFLDLYEGELDVEQTKALVHWLSLP